MLVLPSEGKRLNVFRSFLRALWGGQTLTKGLTKRMRVLGGLGHCCIADVRLLQTAGVVLALVSYIIAMQDRAAAVVISDFEHNGVVDSGAGLHGTGESVATLSIDSSSNMPTNPKLFGLNDVLGPVMHIPYNSKTLISAVESLRIGYLRHPGGGVVSTKVLISTTHFVRFGKKHSSHANTRIIHVRVLPHQSLPDYQNEKERKKNEEGRQADLKKIAGEM